MNETKQIREKRKKEVRGRKSEEKEKMQRRREA